jgi:hypothetical protein
MDLRSIVELAHGSAGRVNMREELDRPRRPPTGGARGFSGFSPWQPGRPWPSRLQRGWMRPAPGFARRPSPPFPPVTKFSRTTVTEGTRLGGELNCCLLCPPVCYALKDGEGVTVEAEEGSVGWGRESRPWRGGQRGEGGSGASEP